MKLKFFKKRYCLGKDDFGNKLYPGDLVELWIPMETKSPYQTKIKWNMLDGAFVECHPAHKLFGGGGDRRLSNFLNQTPTKIFVDEEDKEFVMQTGYCKKIKSVWCL